MSVLLPQLALSVRQPWAWAIAYGYKPVENRDWKESNPCRRFRGQAFLHAGLKEDTEDLDFVVDLVVQQTGEPVADVVARYRQQRHLGGIVGVMKVTDLVTEMDNPWFFGPLGLVIEDARPLPFTSCRGLLGFFRPEADITALLAA